MRGAHPSRPAGTRRDPAQYHKLADHRLRPGGRREAVPAAWSITTEGRKAEEHEARTGLETRLRNGRTPAKIPGRNRI